MPRAVEFGLVIPQRGSLFGLGELRDLLRLGQRAEESELITSLWVGDSFTSKARPESITCLSALAAITDRVRLAVGCMATFPIREPSFFAYQWATLDQVSGGRTLLSVCTGLQPHGASAAEGRHLGGIPDGERAARLEESIEICRQLWSGKSISFHGRFRNYEEIQILPTPVQDPCPIWITANPGEGKSRERILDRIARLADGFQTIQSESGALAALRRDLATHLARLDRPIDDFPISVYHNVNVGSSWQDSFDESLRFAADYYGPGALTGQRLADMSALGSPKECAASLRTLVDAGATHIAIRLTGYDQDEQLRRLIDVLPLVMSS